ncbi:MAG: hypothetical protein ACYDCT_12020 [Dehalococcoidia bacterium]
MIDLCAYADESGIDSRRGYCVVAGYVGSPRQWDRFKTEWGHALGKVPAFHSKRFFGRDENGGRLDHYRGWSEKDADNFINGLLSVIQRHRLTPVGGAIDLSAFNALSVGERRFLTGGHPKAHGGWELSTGAPTKPYYLGFRFLVQEALGLARAGARVHFVFDRQEVLRAHAKTTFGRICRRAVPPTSVQLGDLTFEDCTQTVQLQAADLYANVWHAYLAKRSKLSTGALDALYQLTRKRKGMPVYQTEAFEANLHRLPAEIRKRLRAETS